MSTHPTRRRWLLGGGLFAGLVLAAVVLFRLSLTGLALGGFLKSAGASEVTYQIVNVSPWRVVIENVEFLFKARNYSAKRVSMDRPHWWSATLGHVKVEQAEVPVAIEELTGNTQPAPATASAPAAPSHAWPVEELSFDGRLLVQANGLPEQSLNLDFNLKQVDAARWNGQVKLDGPGFVASATGHYDVTRSAGDFAVSDVALDLKRWQGFVTRLISLPDLTKGWEFEGQVSGWVTGRFTADTLVAQGEVRVREGRVNDPGRKISAQGLELDLTVTDFAKLQARPGVLRITELTTGALPLRNLRAEFALVGPERVEFSTLTLSALGGTLAAEPFAVNPGRDELDAVLLVDNVSVAEVLALTKDLPATATGKVDGRFPIHLDADGLQLGTGWLALKPGVNAEIAFNAKGLLTAGASPNSARYSVLQKVESGLLKLGISEMRLDIRPPDAPAGRSATLHIKGAPLDPEVKAPVILDLNVNGPLEKLINLGLDSRLRVGTKP
jgi:hypothetical protein